MRIKLFDNIFKSFNDWKNKKKETKKEEETIINDWIPGEKDKEDYEEHLYLKENFGYSTKQRRKIIKQWKNNKKT